MREGHVIGSGGGCEEVVDGPLPPFEGGIVLGDLARIVEGVPGVDLDGESEAREEGKGEVEAGEGLADGSCGEGGEEGVRYRVDAEAMF